MSCDRIITCCSFMDTAFAVASVGLTSKVPRIRAAELKALQVNGFRSE